MGGIWFGVCLRSDSVWLWRCGVFMQSEALLVLQKFIFKKQAIFKKNIFGFFSKGTL